MQVRNLTKGFRIPGLIRFVNGEAGYLAPTNGGPRMYINIEDHLHWTTGMVNIEFQVLCPAACTECCTGQSP